jgi:hypothetical protein
LAPLKQTGDGGCEDHIGPAYPTTPANLQHFDQSDGRATKLVASLWLFLSLFARLFLRSLQPFNPTNRLPQLLAL